MTAQTMTYKKARPLMKPGDVIAFGGKSRFSEIIKFATRAEVSHVGVIIQTKVTEDDSPRFFNQIIESTSSNGVAIYRFSDRLPVYDGNIWWLPLRKSIWKNKFDRPAFYEFLFNQAREKKPYDMPQAVGSTLDALDNLPFGLEGPGHNQEDFSKFFCSELVAAGLEVAGVVSEINASEVTPIDLCRWNIYEKNYYQLKGGSKAEISHFNSLKPLAY